MRKFYYDTNDRYEMSGSGYKWDFIDLDDNTVLKTICDTEINARRYFENEYKIKLILVH